MNKFIDNNKGLYFSIILVLIITPPILLNIVQNLVYCLGIESCMILSSIWGFVLINCFTWISLGFLLPLLNSRSTKKKLIKIILLFCFILGLLSSYYEFKSYLRVTDNYLEISQKSIIYSPVFYNKDVHRGEFYIPWDSVDYLKYEYHRNTHRRRCSYMVSIVLKNGDTHFVGDFFTAENYLQKSKQIPIRRVSYC